jgi:hypothetical protein
MVLNAQDVAGIVLRCGSFLKECLAHRVRVEGFWIEPAYPFLEGAPFREVTFPSSRCATGPLGLEL